MVLKKNIKSLVILCAVLSTQLCVHAEEFTIKPNLNRSPLRKNLLLNSSTPKLYKPTKLILGEQTKFKIKAKPGYNVALATSFKNSGAENLNGVKLRLGADLKAQTGIVPENGIIELPISVVDDIKLIGQKVYFEAIVWKNKDYSDAQKAQIIGSAAREVKTNWVHIVPRPKDLSKPGFAPSVGGLSSEAIKGITNLVSEEDQPVSKFDPEYSVNTPAYIKNMKSPELLKEQK